jgi:hypothetical protein
MGATTVVVDDPPHVAIKEYSSASVTERGDPNFIKTSA